MADLAPEFEVKNDTGNAAPVTDTALQTLTGAVTETAPASDTASSGLNGRLQRIAQRLSTLLTSIGTTGAASPTVGILIGGSDGTNLRGVHTDSAGNVYVLDANTSKVTYSASVKGLVPVALATDLFTITGSASKTIYVTRVSFSGTTTTGSGTGTNVTLVKRSTADTAGTATTQPNIPFDSTSAAGTAVVKSYTANPTLGTTVGAIRSSRDSFLPTSLGVSQIVWEFGNAAAMAPALRGVAEQLCINLDGVTVTGGVIDIDIEWTEGT